MRTELSAPAQGRPARGSAVTPPARGSIFTVVGWPHLAAEPRSALSSKVPDLSLPLFGCSTARNKGTCSNRLNIRRDQIEAIAEGVPVTLEQRQEELEREIACGPEPQPLLQPNPAELYRQKV